MELKSIDKEFITKTEDQGIKIVITKNSVDDAYKLFDVNYSDGEYAASVVWMGKNLSTGEQIRQPAIITNNSNTKYLSFDGQANYIGGREEIIMPENGSLYEITPGGVYYFNNENPREYQKDYNLSFNNKSIRMNNISIFNSDFSKGAMFDFRASMEGTFTQEEITGQIVVLSSVLTIN